MQVQVNNAHIDDLKSLLIALGYQYRERERVMREVKRKGCAIVQVRQALVIRAYEE